MRRPIRLPCPCGTPHAPIMCNNSTRMGLNYLSIQIGRMTCGGCDRTIYFERTRREYMRSEVVRDRAVKIWNRAIRAELGKIK